MTGTLALAVRLARRELRGGLRGFRVFLACLGLGVAAIAGVGSVSSAMYDGIGRDARVLIGGDVELRLTHRELPADQIAHLKASGRVSEAVEMRAMAGRAGGERALVELKAVDGLYPLFGALTFDPPGELGAALAVRDGAHGALVEPALAARLGLAVGDRLTVGDASLVVSGIIAKEPDRVASFASFGPRLLVSTAALDATGLVHEGSLIRYHARVALPDGTDVKAWIEDLKQRYPTGGWRVRSLENASPGLDRFISRVTQYLTLVGLTALLVGGVGIANAVRAFLDRRLATIATLKCLGAPGGLVFAVYLIQVLALATVGIAGGLVVGALAPPLAGFAMERFLPFAMPSSIYWQPLLMAAAFGYLITLAFSLWPLGRAREVRAAQLFRALIVPPGGRPRAGYVAATVAAVVVLAALAVLVADDMRLALWFVAGALAVFAAFVAAAVLIMRLARRLPAPRWPGLRLAVANLHRPGAATPSVLLSLGLGLTVLVAIAQVQTNLNRQITERLPEQAPSYFFIDIQPDQAEGFAETIAAVNGVTRWQRTPIVRGRVVAIAGQPVDKVDVHPDAAWVVNGDRGLTYAATPPDGTKLAAGDWWPADYSGPPLISFDARIAEGFGVTIGDTLTINVLGREITATIANLRTIDWGTLAMNFAIVFAPGTLDAAPHSEIATVYADSPATEAAIDRAVRAGFPNVSAIRVKEALDGAQKILDAIAIAVRVTALVTLLAGAMVLAGALSAGQERRVYDAVVLKVLGATRRRVLAAYVAEYGLLGLIAAVFAALIGSAVALVVVTRVMRADFVLDPGVLALTLAGSAVATVVLGLAGTWNALGRKAGPLLRNE